MFESVRPHHLRFGFSAGREVLRAIAVLLAPARRAEQHAWLRRARPLLSGELRAELRHFHFFFKNSPEVFPSLWPTDGVSDVAADIDALRASPEHYMEAVLVRLSGRRLFSADELNVLRERSWYKNAARDYASRDARASAMLDEFVRSPRRSLRRFANAVERFNDAVMQPLVGPIHEMLARDIELRATTMRTHGYLAALRLLSKSIAVSRKGANDCTIRCEGGTDARIVLSDDARLILTPSYFTWPDVQVIALRRPSGLECSIVYPLPALPDRLVAIPDCSTEIASFAALADDVRMRIVQLLARRELSTRELAVFLDASESVVSRHLGILFQAGIVRSRRSSYYVLYRLDRAAMEGLMRWLSELSAM